MVTVMMTMTIEMVMTLFVPKPQRLVIFRADAGTVDGNI